jgi:hypothetical protein
MVLNLRGNDEVKSRKLKKGREGEGAEGEGLTFDSHVGQRCDAPTERSGGWSSALLGSRASSLLYHKRRAERPEVSFLHGDQFHKRRDFNTEPPCSAMDVTKNLVITGRKIVVTC